MRKNNLYDLICDRVIRLGLVDDVERIYKDYCWNEDKWNDRYKSKGIFKRGYNLSLDLNRQQRAFAIKSFEPIDLERISPLIRGQRVSSKKIKCFEETGYFMVLRSIQGEIGGYRGANGVAKFHQVFPTMEYGEAQDEYKRFVKKTVSKKNNKEYKWLRETEIVELVLWKRIKEESKFNLKNDVMSLLDGFKFAKKDSPRSNSASPRESLITYLESQLEKAKSTKDLEIETFVGKDGRKIQAPTTMWGEIGKSGERRLTLKSMNKKLYNSKADALKGLQYFFSATDKKGVIKEIEGILKHLKDSKEGSITMWYKESAKQGGEVKSLEI